MAHGKQAPVAHGNPGAAGPGGPPARRNPESRPAVLPGPPPNGPRSAIPHDTLLIPADPIPPPQRLSTDQFINRR